MLASPAAVHPFQKAGRNTDVCLVPSRCKGFFTPESTFSADSLTVSVHPSCAITCINICAHIKISHPLATLPLSANTKTLQTLVGMGSAAPAAAVA